MTDYSKIDFSKLKLPQWLGGGTVVTKQGKGVTINSLRGLFFEVAANREGDTWEVCLYIGPVTFSELDQLKAICAQVDAFIATELKRIAEEEKPKTTTCPECNGEGHWMAPVCHNERVRERCAGCRGTGQVKDNPLPPWRKCEMEEAYDNWECSQWRPSFGNGDWAQVEPMRIPKTPCQYRTRAPKQSTKPPAVKAPEGWHWEKNVRGEFQLSKPTRSDTFSVPWGKEVRDAMLACVAAFDLEHGTGTASTVTVYSVKHERRDGITLLPSVTGELSNNNPEIANSLISRRFLLVEVSE